MFYLLLLVAMDKSSSFNNINKRNNDVTKVLIFRSNHVQIKIIFINSKIGIEFKFIKTKYLEKLCESHNVMKSANFLLRMNI